MWRKLPGRKRKPITSDRHAGQTGGRKEKNRHYINWKEGDGRKENSESCVWKRKDLDRLRQGQTTWEKLKKRRKTDGKRTSRTNRWWLKKKNRCGSIVPQFPRPSSHYLEGPYYGLTLFVPCLEGLPFLWPCIGDSDLNLRRKRTYYYSIFVRTLSIDLMPCCYSWLIEKKWWRRQTVERERNNWGRKEEEDLLKRKGRSLLAKGTVLVDYSRRGQTWWYWPALGGDGWRLGIVWTDSVPSALNRLLGDCDIELVLCERGLELPHLIVAVPGKRREWRCGELDKREERRPATVVWQANHMPNWWAWPQEPPDRTWPVNILHTTNCGRKGRKKMGNRVEKRLCWTDPNPCWRKEGRTPGKLNCGGWA